jgi:hypothetical protein
MTQMSKAEFRPYFYKQFLTDRALSFDWKY